MPEGRVTVLCSGVALGVYIPALLHESQLRSLGLATEVVLLEDLYHSHGVGALEKLREAFHQRYELAQIAQRMTATVRPHLAADRVDSMLQSWEREDRRHFIVWSGYWMSLLREYRQRRAGVTIHADVCRIDATVSASFRGHDTLSADDREIWFWNWGERRLEHELAVTGEEPVRWEERNGRFVVHGGGWGLGGYGGVADLLEARGVAVDRVVYRRDEIRAAAGGSRYFMVHPEWRPWLRDEGERPELPPFGEVTRDCAENEPFANRDGCHELFRTIRRSTAIISKPGGGTLMDSLSSATPVVFLEPYGEAERHNADLWRFLGFGVTYEEWRDSGFDDSLLARLHGNLVNREAATIDYARDYADFFRTTCRPDGGGH